MHFVTWITTRNLQILFSENKTGEDEWKITDDSKSNSYSAIFISSDFRNSWTLSSVKLRTCEYHLCFSETWFCCHVKVQTCLPYSAHTVTESLHPLHRSLVGPSENRTYSKLMKCQLLLNAIKHVKKSRKQIIIFYTVEPHVFC